LGCSPCRAVHLCPERQACWPLRQVRLSSALSDGNHGPPSWPATGDERRLAIFGTTHRGAAGSEESLPCTERGDLSRPRPGRRNPHDGGPRARRHRVAMGPRQPAAGLCRLLLGSGG
jgi:hypothetical protein